MIIMEEERITWKEALWVVLSIFTVLFGILCMFKSFLDFVLASTWNSSAYEFKAIYEMLISIGFFLIAILIRIW